MFSHWAVVCIALSQLLASPGSAFRTKIPLSENQNRGVFAASTHPAEGNKVGFRLRLMGNGWWEDGAITSSNAYTSQTGNTVWLTIVHYKCEGQVKVAFERQLKLADRISERAPITDEQGNVIAERAVVDKTIKSTAKLGDKTSERASAGDKTAKIAVEMKAIFDESSQEKPAAVIIITNGLRLLLVRSYSLQDCLEFEKQLGVLLPSAEPGYRFAQGVLGRSNGNTH